MLFLLERPLTRLLTAYSRPLFINVAVTGQSRSASAVRATSLCLVHRNCKDGQRFHAPLDVKGLNQREESNHHSTKAKTELNFPAARAAHDFICRVASIEASAYLEDENKI